MSTSRDALCGVFRSMKDVPPRARYLAFCMLKEGLVDWEGQGWRGGIAQLGARVGCSGGGVSSSLKKLVALGFLVKGKEATGGRPVNTYGIDPKPMRWPKNGHFDDRILRILGSEEGGFKALSASERCMLAQLWLTLQGRGAHLSGGACALTGVGVTALAKDAGVGKATAQRLLASLHQKSFILASNADFTADGIAGMTKTYFLLGPAMLEKGARVFRWAVKADGMLSWLAGDSSGYDINQLVAEVYIGGANCEWAERLSAKLRYLSDPARRCYVLTCLCAAATNGFFWGGKVNKTSTLCHVEEAMLRSLKLPVTGPGARHLGIENMSPSILDREMELYGFIAVWAGVLLDKVSAFFPRIPLLEMRLVKPPSYLTCYQVGDDGTRTVQIDAVFFDVDSGDNFRVKIEDWHARFGIPMPEQFYSE